MCVDNICVLVLIREISTGKTGERKVKIQQELKVNFSILTQHQPVVMFQINFKI